VHSDALPSRITAADGHSVELTPGHIVLDQFNIIVVRSALQPASSGIPLRSQRAKASELLGSLRSVTRIIASQEELLSKLVEAGDAAISARRAASSATRDYKHLCRTNSMSNPAHPSRRSKR
jgi:hypothetical protein